MIVPRFSTAIRTVLIVTFIFGLIAGGILLNLPAARAHIGSPARTTFVDGDPLTAAQLNDSFSHVDNVFSGGITDSMVSGSASLQHSKLATPALLPKAWALVGVAALCNGAAAVGTPCSVDVSSRISSVVAGGVTGQYNVNLAYTPTNANFGILATGRIAGVNCNAGFQQTAAPQLVVYCFTGTTGAATNTPFTVMVLDD